jgi:glycosyltransferase involved in cell wall biosynthesis
MLPKVAWLCCTFRRPKLLGHLIDCFLKQDYPADRRVMLILDDDNEYEMQERDGWKIISVPDRYPSLGEKRNALAAMVSNDTDILCPVDDDELLLSHTTSAHAAALTDADWSVPSRVYAESDNIPGHIYARSTTGCCYPSSWAYTREFFVKTGGYPPISLDEDGEWRKVAYKMGARIADPTKPGHAPFYICRRHGDTYHMHSENKDTSWQDVLRVPRSKRHEVVVTPGYRMVNGLPRLT